MEGLTLSPLVLGFLSGSVIPLATGVLTKLHAPSGVKAIMSALLAALTAVLAYVTETGGVVDLTAALIVFFTAWITNAGTYYGFWKPTGVAPAVQEGTSTVGVG